MTTAAVAGALEGLNRGLQAQYQHSKWAGEKAWLDKQRARTEADWKHQDRERDYLQGERNRAEVLRASDRFVREAASRGLLDPVTMQPVKGRASELASLFNSKYQPVLQQFVNGRRTGYAARRVQPFGKGEVAVEMDGPNGPAVLTDHATTAPNDPVTAVTWQSLLGYSDSAWNARQAHAASVYDDERARERSLWELTEQRRYDQEQAEQNARDLEKVWGAIAGAVDSGLGVAQPPAMIEGTLPAQRTNLQSSETPPPPTLHASPVDSERYAELVSQYNALKSAGNTEAAEAIMQGQIMPAYNRLKQLSTPLPPGSNLQRIPLPPDFIDVHSYPRITPPINDAFYKLPVHEYKPYTQASDPMFDGLLHKPSEPTEGLMTRLQRLDDEVLGEDGRYRIGADAYQQLQTLGNRGEEVPVSRAPQNASPRRETGLDEWVGQMGADVATLGMDGGYTPRDGTYRPNSPMPTLNDLDDRMLGADGRYRIGEDAYQQLQTLAPKQVTGEWEHPRALLRDPTVSQKVGTGALLQPAHNFRRNVGQIADDTAAAVVGLENTLTSMANKNAGYPWLPTIEPRDIKTRARPAALAGYGASGDMGEPARENIGYESYGASGDMGQLAREDIGYESYGATGDSLILAVGETLANSQDPVVKDEATQAVAPIVHAAEQDVKQEQQAIKQAPAAQQPKVEAQVQRRIAVDERTVERELAAPTRTVPPEAIKALSRLVARGKVTVSDAQKIITTMRNPRAGWKVTSHKGDLLYYNPDNPREFEVVVTGAGDSGGPEPWDYGSQRSQINAVARRVAATHGGDVGIHYGTDDTPYANERYLRAVEMAARLLAEKGHTPPTDSELAEAALEILNSAGGSR